MEYTDRLQLNETLMRKLSNQSSTLVQFKNWLWANVDRVSSRKIDSKGNVYPKTFISNRINNSKSNFVTFIPLLLYNNFKHFLNLYFLILALLQFFPKFRVGVLKRLSCLIHSSNHNHHRRIFYQRIYR